MISFRLRPVTLIKSVATPYAGANGEYAVLFEGAASFDPSELTIWFITIEKHPLNGRVVYVLEKKESGKWEKAIGINVMELMEEDAFLSWVLKMIK